jgi:hypothetical protein
MVRAADAITLTIIASLVSGDHVSGRRVTGSMRVPTMRPVPTAAQTAPAATLGPVLWACAAAMAAVTGIGHGAATPTGRTAASRLRDTSGHA